MKTRDDETVCSRKFTNCPTENQYYSIVVTMSIRLFYISVTSHHRFGLAFESDDKQVIVLKEQVPYNQSKNIIIKKKNTLSEVIAP